MSQLLGLRTVVYGVSNLIEAKAWYQEVLGQAPYFEGERYVGFSVKGFELGLYAGAHNVAQRSDGVVAYWGVESIAEQVKRISALGAQQDGKVEDVGNGILMAVLTDPFGNLFGLIENPDIYLPHPAITH